MVAVRLTYWKYPQRSDKPIYSEQFFGTIRGRKPLIAAERG
jgi:hypothetical protein